MATGIIVSPGTAVTTTQTYTNQINPTPGGYSHLPQAQALRIITKVTAVSGTSPTLTVTVNGMTYLGTPYNLGQAGAAASSATINTAGTYVWTLSAGAVAAAGTSPVFNGVAPSQYQVVLTVGGTTPSFTLSVEYDQSGN